MFDVDANLEADDRFEPSLSTSRRRSCRLRFPPGLVRVEAYTGEHDDSIDETHL